MASLALVVGPLFSALGARIRPAQALMDGFALALVAGLCVVFVLPHTLEALGLTGLALAGLGVALPALGHRVLRAGSWSLTVIAAALLAHVVLDGAVLRIRGEDAALAWAVVTHRLPVGFAVVIAAQASGAAKRVTWALTLALVAATLVGFIFAPVLPAILPASAGAALEAVVAGVLLHVVIQPHATSPESDSCGHTHDVSGAPQEREQVPMGHADHHHPHCGQQTSPAPTKPAPHSAPPAGQSSMRPWAGLGALGGLLALFVGALFAGRQALEATVYTLFETFGVLALNSAPALLLGYTLAGIVPLFVTPANTNALSRGGTFAQAVRGVAFGLPLPICSCGVLPLYESLVRRGAPPAAALAFFVATPELGLDAVLLSVPLLGTSLTVARVVTALVVALLVALLLGERPTPAGQTRPGAAEQVPGNLITRVRAGLHFGFVEVFDHTMPWIIVGLVIAAMAEPMLSHGAIETISPIFQVPLAALVGVPVYVCASGATPAAALALHKGLSTGAAIAFLIAGPVTNLTTFGVLARLHGRRKAILFGVSVTTLAILAGWLVDGLGVDPAPVLEGHDGLASHATPLGWFCLLVLGVLSIASLLRQGPRGALRQILEPIHRH